MTSFTKKVQLLINDMLFAGVDTAGLIADVEVPLRLEGVKDPAVLYKFGQNAGAKYGYIYLAAKKLISLATEIAGPFKREYAYDPKYPWDYVERIGESQYIIGHGWPALNKVAFLEAATVNPYIALSINQWWLFSVMDNYELGAISRPAMTMVSENIIASKNVKALYELLTNFKGYFFAVSYKYPELHKKVIEALVKYDTNGKFIEKAKKALPADMAYYLIKAIGKKNAV